APLIEQLEREHQELIALLEAVDAAIAALVADPTDDTRRTVHDSIAAVRDTLVPHLDVQDAQLPPAAAATVAAKERGDPREGALRWTGRSERPVAAGILEEVARSLPPEQQPPPPPMALRMMLALSWRRRYAKFVEPLT